VLDRIAQVELPLFGDVVVFKYGRTYSHGGIVVARPYVLHASAPAQSVLVEDIEKSPYASNPRQFYSYWKGGRA
jgi:cell wall-associated NlpC family hydrolase